LEVFDVLGRDRIAADTPVTAFDFVDRDPGDSTQRLSLDAHHCLSELGDHLSLLAAIEYSFDDFDLYKWHDASFLSPVLGGEISIRRVAAGGLQGSCHPTQAATSVLQVRLQ
jgi:hypothetical protein